MKSKNCRIALISLFCLFLFGCGASESYKMDQDMARQRREEATIIYDKAKQSLTGADLNLTVLEQLAKEVERAVNLDPDNTAIAAFSSSLNEKAEGMRTKLKSLYADAEADMQKEDWVAAADKLKQINGILPNYEDTSARL
ncbi:MAG: hypothetical protein Q8O44_05780, partial [Syntrophales bacterium]|nr:hypothetical protein [Syntrophales bacterium]